MHAYASSHRHSLEVISLGLVAIIIAIFKSFRPAIAETDVETAIRE